MSPCGGECRVGRTLPRGGPSSPAPRRRSAAPPASPDRHQQTIDVGRRAAAAHCRTERRTGALAQLAHPAGRSRMLIALHGLALRKASDAISPLNAVVEPGCCRTPPPSSRRQRLIRRAPRARARGFGASRRPRPLTMSSRAQARRRDPVPPRPPPPSKTTTAGPARRSATILRTAANG